MTSQTEGPDPRRIRAVQRRLRARQGAFSPKPRLPVIDEIIATVLSQHTSDVNSERAFRRLKQRFPAWEQVLHAPPGEVADAIRCGGIADQKARRIQQILAAIDDREGRIDLARLDDLGDAEAEEYLRSLPGVGWIAAGTSADRAHQLLAPRVPPDIRYDLHLALITHGRTVCRAQRPRCDECVLRDLCAYTR
jgi:endonuclease-3